MDAANRTIVMNKDHVCQGRLKGKNAIVTAGTKGIGLGCVLRLLSEGARVFLCSRKEKNVEQTLQDLEEKGFSKDVVSGVTCNVGNDQQLEDFVNAAVHFFGGEEKCTIDVLVSNAGVNPQASFDSLELDMKIYDKIFNINVRSYFLLVRLCRPYLKRGSSIIFMSSVGGFQPAPPLAIYGVSKTAVIALGRSLAQELGPKGIRVNSICPGIIRTKMSSVFWENSNKEAEARSNFLQQFGDPAEIGSICAFLASDDSSYITGEAIVASGGVSSRM